jgi:hypothetical protein
MENFFYTPTWVLYRIFTYNYFSWENYIEFSAQLSMEQRPKKLLEQVQDDFTHVLNRDGKAVRTPLD